MARDYAKEVAQNWQLIATVFLRPDPAGRGFGTHLEQWSFVKVKGLARMRYTDRPDKRGLVLRDDPWRMVYISDRLTLRERDERIGRCIREIERRYRRGWHHPKAKGGAS